MRIFDTGNRQVHLRKPGFLMCLLACITSLVNSQTMDPIPRDTSYTVRSTYLKLCETYPFIEAVQEFQHPAIREARNITYKRSGLRELHLDLYAPATSGENKKPCIVCIHGGGWASGNRSLLAPLAQSLVLCGYVAVTVEYRLSPEALYPAGVLDVKSAIQWIKKNADSHSIDTNRMAVLGASAGGTLATLVGNTPLHPQFLLKGQAEHSDQVQAIVNIDGILDFTDPAESGKDHDPAKPSAAARWFGSTYREDPGLWIQASPLSYAGPHSPSTLFINSTVPRFHAGRDEYIEKLNGFGIHTQVYTLPDSPHSFWLFHPWFDTTVRRIHTFLNAAL